MDHTAIRLLIVDDHPVFRRGLVSLLQEEHELEVVGQAANGAEALQLIQKLQPDIVLMDVKMPGEDGIEVTRVLLEASPTARIIVLTVSEEIEDVLRAILAGVRGYLLKNADADELLRTFRRVRAGEAVLSPALTLRVFEALRSPRPGPAADSLLTPREREVLDLLARGLDNRRIAAALTISENTVKTHVGHILEKLHLKSRREVVDQDPPASAHRLGRRKP